MRPDISRWRDRQTYDDFDSLTTEGLAWECLRRDEAYQQYLRLMMQAVDGWTNGVSYREIAIVQFGRERVAADPWKTSALRDMVIGLVESGVAMIGGGYLQLLRHRRKS